MMPFTYCRYFLRWAIFMLLTGLWQLAYAACSPHVGKVVFNELYQPNSGTSFLEIKVLDPAVVSATNNFQNWKIDMYDGSFSRKQSVDVSSGFSNASVNNCGTVSQWIRFPESVLSYLNTEAPPYNFVLYDSASGGQIVDILRVGDTINSYYGSGSQYQTCSSIEPLPSNATANSQYDAQENSGASVKDWYRIPDGTGPWGGQGTSNPGNTSCGNNAGGSGTFGLAKVPSVTSVPTSTNFTYTLWATNGGTAVTSPASVVITDNLNTAGLTFVSCAASPGTTSGTSAGPTGTCTHSGGVVTWTVGAMAANKQYKVTLTVRADSAGGKINKAISNVGSPFAEVTAATVQVYAPLADWHMDEASWNGTAGEVVDSSGNGYHGRARRANGSTAVASTSSGSPAYTTGSLNTCGYGEFDKTSSPARTYSYVELSSIPALPSSFTFAAWIRSTNAGAQHQRILVRDDADNGWGLSLADGTGQGKLRFFNRNITNNGSVTGQGTNPGCGVFCVDTDAVITSNAWYFIAAAIDTTGKRVTLYVFDSAGTLQATASGAFSGTWQDGTGLAAIGGETSASSEGTQPSWHFLGNIDEMQIYSGVLSRTDLDLLRTRARSCATPSVNHVEFVHDGASLTCTANPVTVLGCTGSSSCNGVPANQIAGNVTFTPTAISGAQWCYDALCASPISASATVANGSTIYLREPTARTDTMGGTASGASNATVQCTNTATNAFNSTTACEVSFSSSGFVMNAANHYACTPQTITVKAVQSNATSTACVPAFANVTRNVALFSTYSNPSTGTRQASLSYATDGSGGTAAVSALSTSSGSPTALNGLYFDGTGTATLSNFRYSDVGLLALQASYTGSSATNDSGLNMVTVSGHTFVAAPSGFAFSAIPAAPLTAGDPFNVTLTAMNACASPTTAPNFGKETSPAVVTLSSANPQPAVGNSTPVNQSVSGFGQSPSPAATASANVVWKEVGTVDLVASLSNYLGSGLDTSTTQSAVGRFKPAYFDTAVTTPGCGTFTYSGQPVQKIDVTAKATGGTSTANYAGATWAKAVTLTDGNGGTGTWANNTIPATGFSSGVGSSTTAAYTFASRETAPATIKIRASEPSGADGVNSIAGAEATTPIRSGRVRLFNAYGSEKLDLPMTMRSEYWNTSGASGGWQINTADICTNTSLAFAPVPAVTDVSANTCVWDSGNPGSSAKGCATAGVSTKQFKEAGVAGFAGNFNLWLQAPSIRGAIDVTATVPAWLQYNWTGTVANPTGRATFGVYKSPLIYRRENY